MLNFFKFWMFKNCHSLSLNQRLTMLLNSRFMNLEPPIKPTTYCRYKYTNNIFLNLINSTRFFWLENQILEKQVTQVVLSIIKLLQVYPPSYRLGS